MAFLYETHLHTCQGSACGKSTGTEHVRHYHRLGYAGVIITDHFFGGNTAIPRDLPWEERIRLFCAGYEDALEEGRRLGMDVFFGWEQTFQGDDYLVYGLDKAWMLQHPEMEHWTRREQLEQVHRCGGAVIQAHPFRERDYIKHVRLGLQFADGIEAANGGNDQKADAAALRYAKAHGLWITSGSDNHHVEHVTQHPEKVYGIETPQRFNSIHDYVDIILNRRPIGLHVPENRFDLPEDRPFIPSNWMDTNENPVPTGIDWLSL